MMEFYLWIPHEKRVMPYVFFVRIVSHLELLPVKKHNGQYISKSICTKSLKLSQMIRGDD